MLIAGYKDLKTRTIPNIITLPFILIGLIVNLFIGEYRLTLLGFLVSFGLGFLLFLTGGMGGGDAKLMAGLGAWLGTLAFFNILFIASVIGVIIYMIWAIKNKIFKEKSIEIFSKLYLLKSTGSNLIKYESKNNTVAFGTCLALATLIYFIAGGVYYF